MKIEKSELNVYFLHKVTDTNIKLCKILNEYDDMKDANADLVNLLTEKKKEKDILNEYSKKETF
jgi:hypothetical protein